MMGLLIKARFLGRSPVSLVESGQFVASHYSPRNRRGTATHESGRRREPSDQRSPRAAVYLGPFTIVARVMQEGLAFRSKGSIGVSGRQRRERALSNRPIGLTDPGLVLVRGSDYRTSRMRERLDHECQTYRCSQTYRRTTCDDERCGTTQGPLLVGAGNDQGRGSQQGWRQTREILVWPARSR